MSHDRSHLDTPEETDTAPVDRPPDPSRRAEGETGRRETLSRDSPSLSRSDAPKPGQRKPDSDTEDPMPGHESKSQFDEATTGAGPGLEAPTGALRHEAGRGSDAGRGDMADRDDDIDVLWKLPIRDLAGALLSHAEAYVRNYENAARRFDAGISRSGASSEKSIGAAVVDRVLAKTVGNSPVGFILNLARTIGDQVVDKAVADSKATDRSAGLEYSAKVREQFSGTITTLIQQRELYAARVEKRFRALPPSEQTVLQSRMVDSILEFASRTIGEGSALGAMVAEYIEQSHPTDDGRRTEVRFDVDEADVIRRVTLVGRVARGIAEEADHLDGTSKPGFIRVLLHADRIHGNVQITGVPGARIPVEHFRFNAGLHIDDRDFHEVSERSYDVVRKMGDDTITIPDTVKIDARERW